MSNYILPKRAIVTTVSDGSGYRVNDEKYIGKAYNRVVEIVDELEHGFLLTNFYLPEFKELNNDYCRYGFLVVTLSNIEWV